MRRIIGAFAAASTLALGACAAAPPAGPSVMALPGKDKSFEAFQQDDAACRQFAALRLGGGTPEAAANQSLVNSAAAGTVLGAAAGAAIGAATGNPAAGAAIGAGSGLFLGGAAGANAAELSSGEMQRLYDMSYVQCMYAKGESVPQSLPSYAYAPAYAYPYAGYYPYYPWYGPYYGSSFVGFGFGFHGHHGHHWHH
jgi:Glycine-zipper domain